MKNYEKIKIQYLMLIAISYAWSDTARACEYNPLLDDTTFALQFESSPCDLTFDDTFLPFEWGSPLPQEPTSGWHYLTTVPSYEQNKTPSLNHTIEQDNHLHQFHNSLDPHELQTDLTLLDKKTEPVSTRATEPKRSYHAKTDSSTQRTNEIRHDSQKPFMCDFAKCDFTTKYSDSLNAHRRTHTLEKPFWCSFAGCNFATAQSSNLSRHKKKHAPIEKKGDMGKKKYTCNDEQCDYATNNKSAMQKHKRTHSGDKPFTCTFTGCTYATGDPSALAKHVRKHTGEKPYICGQKECYHASSRLDYFKKHHDIKHPGQPMSFKCNFLGCAFKQDTFKQIQRHKIEHEPWNQLAGKRKRNEEEEE